MRARLPHILVALAAVPLCFAACTEKPGLKTGSVVVGITSKLTPGTAIDAMHLTIKAGDAVIVDDTLTSAANDLKFPTEVRVDGLTDGEPVDVAIEGSFGGQPILSRIASTEGVEQEVKLLRVNLSAACLNQVAPSCAAPLTCDAGGCIDGHVQGSDLPTYTSDWSTTTTTVDVCKPKDAGDPIVTVGYGQADYLPLMDGDVAQVEAGPQGGHHIWTAVRLKNLTQSGSITSLTGHFPDLGYDVGPFNVIFTFDPDEGGYCKIYGLRFQLDTEHDIQEMLGHTLEMTATITDKDKTVGVGKRTVKLSDTILGQ